MTISRFSFLFIILFVNFLSFDHLYAQSALVLEDTVVDQEIYHQYPRYRLTQIGFSYNTLRDESLSLLLYSGIGSVISLQYWKYKGEKKLVQNTFSFDASTLTNGVNDHLITGLDFSYQHMPLYPVRLSPERMRLYVGGFFNPALNIKVAPENVNNAVSYELLMATGPAALYQYAFKLLGEEVIVADQLSFPLLSLLMRPQYAWPAPVLIEEEGRLGQDLQFGSWGRHFSITNQVSVNFYTHKKRKRKVFKKVSHQLSYRWNYQIMRYPNLLQDASHTLTYSRVLKID